LAKIKDARYPIPFGNAHHTVTVQAAGDSNCIIAANRFSVKEPLPALRTDAKHIFNNSLIISQLRHAKALPLPTLPQLVLGTPLPAINITVFARHSFLYVHAKKHLRFFLEVGELSDIRKLREHAGLTQFEAARLAGIDRSRLALAEGGQLPLSTDQNTRVRRALLRAIRLRRDRLDTLLANV
jgi:hypothetical protein